MTTMFRQDYTPVKTDMDKPGFHDNDVSDPLMEDGLHASSNEKCQRRWHNLVSSSRARGSFSFSALFNVLVLILNVAAITYWSMKARDNGTPWAKYIGPQVTPPSIAQDMIEHSLQRFTDPDDRLSPYAADPSDEVDDAWDRLIDNGRSFSVSPELFAATNGHPDTGVRIPDDPEGNFVGILEVTHQLHCVDIMRRGAWFNIARYRDRQYFGNKSDAAVIWHMRHCFEVLRQTIMCAGDTSLLTYNWIKDYPAPQSAWQSLHSCQNWDRLMEWRRANDVTPRLKFLDRPLWVMDPDGVVPGEKGAAEVRTHGGVLRTKTEKVAPVLDADG